MTRPRMVLPGSAYLVTRRTAERQFLLRPGEDTNAIFDFCLAVAAERFNIGLIAWVAMSNHYHAVVHDEAGNISSFIQYFHKLLSNVLNTRWERAEKVWSGEETCLTRLVTEEDVIDKVAYVLANPVAADLVEKAAEWPGASSLDYLDGEARTISRPRIYFGKKKTVVQATANLVAVLPYKTKLSRGTFVAEVLQRVRAIELANATRRRKKKLNVLGAAAACATRHTSRPSKEARPSKLRPRVSCRDEEKRIEALLLLKQFWLHYDEALLEFLKDTTSAIFPEGTLNRAGHPKRRIGQRPPSAKRRVMLHLSRIPT